MATIEFTTEELENEEWRSVFGYSGYYSVSNLGRVRRDTPYKNTPPGGILKQTPNNFGYLRVGLSKKSRVRHFYVHALVARAFICDRPKGKVVGHKNHKPADNHASNLQYISQARNIRDSIQAGRMAVGDLNVRRRYPEINKHGEDNPAHVLTAEQVKEIRCLAIQDHRVRPLARRFHVSRSTIKSIIQRITWKHVE